MPRRPNVNTGDPLLDAAAALNSRQLTFAQKVLAGTPPRDAHIQAGYADHQGNAYQRLSQPSIQAYMLAVLTEKGFGVPEIADTMIDVARNATTMVVDRDGVEHTHPDFRTKLQATDTIGKWVGAIGPRDRNEGPSVTVIVNVTQPAGWVETVEADTVTDVTEGEIIPPLSS